MKPLLALLLFCLAATVMAKDFSQDFAVVFINEATEARYGRIPLERSLLAQAVDNASKAGAKAIMIKFFLDQARTATSDQQLATSIATTPVLLQARIDPSEHNPNELPKRFTLPETDYSTAISGDSGWIPLPAFAEHAHDVCFVDFDDSPVPVVETYQGKTVKSLLLCAAELAIGQKAIITPSKSLAIGQYTAPLDALNRVTVTSPTLPTFTSLEFNQLIDGTHPTSALQDKVVIIAYEGANIPTVKTPFGDIGLHRRFVQLLQTFYESLATAESLCLPCSPPLQKEGLGEDFLKPLPTPHSTSH